MLDFGEELTLESNRIPWLIWIQLIVLLLLLALFFLLSFDDFDPNHPNATIIPSPSPASASASISRLHTKSNGSSSAATLTNRLQNTRGEGNLSIKGEIATSTSTRIVREEIPAEGEASPLYFLHPCHYFKLARVAFLKCLGLDESPDTPPNRKHRKRKES